MEEAATANAVTPAAIWPPSRRPRSQASGTGGKREDDREPAERVRRAVGHERKVREHEVERRPAPLPPDGLEHLAEWPGGDEPRDRLVLEQGLPAHVLDEADGEEDCPRQRSAEVEHWQRRKPRWATAAVGSGAWAASRSAGRSSVSVTRAALHQDAAAAGKPPAR